MTELEEAVKRWTIARRNLMSDKIVKGPADKLPGLEHPEYFDELVSAENDLARLGNKLI